jgi:hypothetical protein
LGEVETPRSSRQGTRPAIDDLSVGYCARRRSPRSGLSRSDLVHWPMTSLTAAQHHTRSWRNSRHGGRRHPARCLYCLAGCHFGPLSILRIYFVRLARTSIVAKAKRSKAADREAAPDGLPVHSFRSLLGDPTTVTRNTMAIAGQPDAPFVLYPHSRRSRPARSSFSMSPSTCSQ